MSEKKTVVVTTKPQEVEIEANLITDDELRQVWLNVRGGNADQDNVELMRHLAVNVVKDEQIKRAMHFRAAMLEQALDQIKNMIWPQDKADEVLDLKKGQEKESAA